jgi:hypothetical protein
MNLKLKILIFSIAFLLVMLATRPEWLLVHEQGRPDF